MTPSSSSQRRCLPTRGLRTVFRRMVSRADIAHRYSFLDPQKGAGQFSPYDANEFYRLGNFPNTARRMELFEQSAPVLMRKAVDRLALSEKERSRYHACAGDLLHGALCAWAGL